MIKFKISYFLFYFSFNFAMMQEINIEELLQEKRMLNLQINRLHILMRNAQREGFLFLAQKYKEDLHSWGIRLNQLQLRIENLRPDFKHNIRVFHLKL